MSYKHRAHARLIKMADGSIGLESSYDRRLVLALKTAIPGPDRRWDGVDEVWRIAPRQQYVDELSRICQIYLGLEPTIPPGLLGGTTAQKVVELVKMLYLGLPKDRGDTEPSSMGYADNDWSLLFPLSVLRRWFDLELDEGLPEPTKMLSLYAVLGIKKSATQEDLKKAYRRAAKTWHPDYCQEDDAAAQFIRIKAAYDVLKDPAKRKRYDMGLILEASLANAPKTAHDRYSAFPSSGSYQSAVSWRPPLRCGLLMLEGAKSLGRLRVSKILKWEDIINSKGQVLVTSWHRGANHFTERWV